MARVDLILDVPTLALASHMRMTMPELTSATLSILRTQLREQLLRAADALANEQCPDADALALTRNTAAAVLTTIDTVATSPLLAPAWAA